MFYKKKNENYRQPLEGIEMKTLVFGQRTLMSEFRLENGKTLPLHSHPHEQTGYLVSGRIRLTIGTETYDTGPGDSWCIPENVEHGAETLEDSVVLEVFSPVKEDYLPAK
jgi:quercetin dioxygenase-like cupin family protein